MHASVFVQEEVCGNFGEEILEFDLKIFYL